MEQDGREMGRKRKEDVDEIGGSKLEPRNARWNA